MSIGHPNLSVFAQNQFPTTAWSRPLLVKCTAPNVGSRLMEKMGWQAGQGLGRSNQGRTQIIEAEFREAGVGLGIKTSKRGPQSDNYKDNVKRAMFARFHELE
ncbi:unnamed protein product [Trichobilharzia regenti]|nr:unnamed protein product [Trichobilharzia regenti]